MSNNRLFLRLVIQLFFFFLFSLLGFFFAKYCKVLFLGLISTCYDENIFICFSKDTLFSSDIMRVCDELTGNKYFSTIKCRA